jgi:hypothetical protein
MATRADADEDGDDLTVTAFGRHRPELLEDLAAVPLDRPHADREGIFDCAYDLPWAMSAGIIA